MNYPTISLFSGAMGLDLGLMQAGLQIKVSQDIDPWVGKTMTANHHPHIIGDIKEMIANDPNCLFLQEKTGLQPGEVFAVVGGPPCQSFSTAGKRKGIDDPRGSLFMEFAHVVKTFRPRFFVMENVKGLLSSKVPENEEGHENALDVVLHTFKSIGYHTVHGVLNAVNYGVPQFRERLIIIGSRDNEDIFLPLPTHFQRHQNPMCRWQTLQDTISDLAENPGECGKLSENRAKFFPHIPMGGNWRDLPENLKEEAMGGALHSGGGKTGFFRRLHYHEPSPTLLTSPIQKASMLIHPTEIRPLSISEYRRIQQFPENWIIEGNTNDKYRQIGNAVPVGLGKAIGDVLLSIAADNNTVHSKRIKRNEIQQAIQQSLHM